MKKLAKSIRRIGLVVNPEKPSSRALVRKAAALVEAGRRTVLADAATARFAGLDAACADVASLAKQSDLLMVFGGDGTMLRVAREAAGSPTPIVGINVGSLGFLTDVQAHQLPLALKQIWAGETILESRSLIEVRGRLGSGLHVAETALNDFVISRGAAPRLIELEVSVDAHVLTRYRCDGLIVCTPTGSTAYSLSAGGAVVSPTADVFTITPICPHTLSNRSVIVGLDSTVRVKVLSDPDETFLTADGQKMLPLAAGDEITIRRSRRAVRLLHLAGSSFFETLRRKLNWSGSNV